jgi:putative DNA primase/helicase
MIDERTAVLEAALSYAARGWRVFPCDPHPMKPKSKRPLVGAEHDEAGKAIEGSGWPKKASADPEQIRAWWRRWPTALIGMAPGWAEAFVVDLDPKGEPVEAVEARLAAAIGGPVPRGPRTRTQSGGLHLWFRRPAREVIGNTTPGLANIDIRCDLGYVILPPSKMGNGNAYAWIGQPFDGDAPEVPAALLALIDGRERHETHGRVGPQPISRAPPPALPHHAGEEARRRYARGALDKIRSEIASTSAKRGTALYAGACAAGRLLAHGAISEREALAALVDGAELCGLVGTDGIASVERDIQRGFAEGRATAAEVGQRLDEVEAEAEKRSRRTASNAPRAPEPPPWEPDGSRWEATDSTEPSGSEPDDGDDVDLVVEPEEPGADVDMAIVERCAALDHSDTDNSVRLLSHFGTDLLIRSQEGGREPVWCGWVGTHWEDVNGKAVAIRRAQRLGDRIKLEGAFLQPTPTERATIEAGKLAAKTALADRSDEDTLAIEKAAAAQKIVDGRRGKRITFGVSSKNKARVVAMLEMAAPHVMRDPSDFNADPLVLVTKSHTLRFRRERVPESGDTVAHVEAIEGHRREDLVTRVVPVAWRPGASAPRWQAMLERFQPDPEQRRFLQVATGLGCLGLTEQVLIFHYGSGANSKSVFLECVARTLGPLAAGLPAEAVAGDERGGGGLKASPEIARLYATRFVRISEIPQGEPLKEEFVKRITGGERFPARALFEGYFEFQPVFIPHMSGNGYPRIVGTDNGIWRRMRVIHWPVQLEDRETRNFSDVVGELMEEAEGILEWIVEGARIYLEEGLVTPPSVMAATELMRDENDPVKRFFEAAVTVTGLEADRVAGGKMYAAYTAWANGDHVPVNRTRFGLNLTKITERHGVAKDKTTSGLIEYIGIRLKRDPGTHEDPGWQPGEQS